MLLIGTPSRTDSFIVGRKQWMRGDALAEEEGFEPPSELTPLTVFKTAGFNHSPIPPLPTYQILIVGMKLRIGDWRLPSDILQACIAKLFDAGFGAPGALVNAHRKALKEEREE